MAANLPKSFAPAKRFCGMLWVVSMWFIAPTAEGIASTQSPSGSAQAAYKQMQAWVREHGGKGQAASEWVRRHIAVDEVTRRVVENQASRLTEQQHSRVEQLIEALLAWSLGLRVQPPRDRVSGKIAPWPPLKCSENILGQQADVSCDVWEGAAKEQVYLTMVRQKGRWKLCDIETSGFALVADHRSQVADIVRAAGSNALVERLEYRVKSLQDKATTVRQRP